MLKPTVLIVVFAAICGCSNTSVDSGPSYSELVITYNAEMEALDRLETKREKLVSEFGNAIKAVEPAKTDGGGASLAPGELLKKAREKLAEGDVDLSADPSELLDQLSERSGDAGEIADQLLGLIGEKPAEKEAEVSEPTEEELAAIAAVKEKFEPQIAELDKEIQAQTARVKRARDARNAAEATQAESAESL